MKKLLIGLALLASASSVASIGLALSASPFASNCSEAKAVEYAISLVNSVDIGGYTVKGEDMGVSTSKTSEGNFLVNLIYTASNDTYKLTPRIGTMIFNPETCEVILSQSSKVEFRWK